MKERMEREKTVKEVHALYNESDRDHSTDESGFSEKQQALDIEMRAGEYQKLRNQPFYQKQSRQGKIVLAYQTISHRLNELVGKYPEEGTTLSGELQKFRLMQEFLINCLIWESQGELEKNMVPPQLWELIE